MPMSKTAIPVSVVLFAVPVWSKVFVRWTQPVPPPAKRLGVNEIVIPWNAAAPSSVQSAAERGYRVYAEVAMSEASSVAKAAARSGLAGIIVNPGDAHPDQIDQSLRKLRSAYPKLIFLGCKPNGKQAEGRRTVNLKENCLFGGNNPNS